MSTRTGVRKSVVFSIISIMSIGIGASCIAQDNMPSFFTGVLDPDTTAPVHMYSLNMAVLHRIDGVTEGFGVVNIGDTTLLFCQGGAHSRDTLCVYDVSNPNMPTRLGSIRMDSLIHVRDIEFFVDQDSTTRLLIAESDRDKTGMIPNARLISIPLTSENLIKLSSDTHYTAFAGYHVADFPLYPSADTNTSKTRNVEMIHQRGGLVFAATNKPMLVWFDVSDTSTITAYSHVFTPPLPTFEEFDINVHEIKTEMLGDTILAGVSLVSRGMCLMKFDANGNLVDSVFQIYDYDRTGFPHILLNPHKEYYDTTIYSGDDQRNNKWDYRICHSVLPYSSAGGRYVLTVDEYTSFRGYQNIDTVWIPEAWELLDFYPRNTCTAFDTVSVYYRGIPQGIVSLPYALLETSAHRLNYANRSMPGRPATDPNKFQGAFVRIWNRDSLNGRNDTTINHGGLLLNAYDVQEGDGHPEGYTGLDNIPDTSLVPTGLHEPVLAGNRLYLAGYNGVRSSRSSLF